MQGPYAIVVPAPAVADQRDGRRLLAEHVQTSVALHRVPLTAVRWHDAFLEVRTSRPVQALQASAHIPGVAYAGIGWMVRSRLPLISEAALQIAQRVLVDGGAFSVNVVAVGNPNLVVRDVETGVTARVLAGLAGRRVRLASRRSGTALHVILADDEALVFDWLMRGMGGQLLVAGELGVFVVDRDPASVVAGWLALRLGIAPVFLTYTPAGDAGRLPTAVMDGLARLRDYVPLPRVDLFVVPDPDDHKSRGPDVLMRALIAEQLALQLRASWIVGALASTGPSAAAYRQIATAVLSSVKLLEPTLTLTDEEISDLATRILSRPIRLPGRARPEPDLALDTSTLTQYRAHARALVERAEPRPVPALAEFTRQALK